ncbi:polysaccharide biosynthesis tyrosine autokinase [Lignipirellula cremea]|uniref:Tyrosine-protein kinase wzc n=1 Tax=Lignipirellula cremea TaxID=2528010 RepID=A0A518DRX3_9BACT|nr:polysaccharide biosynthesis tyrosine autokinase [Lignipirellula cremea]QDU94579.1 Tyrosine-protein kinase wzc [Lignipirellula cremea]
MTTELSLVSPDAEGSSPRDIMQAALRFLQVLRRRKGYVLAMLAGAAVLGAAYYVAAPRMYEAKASLLITQTGPDVMSGSTPAASGGDSLIPTYEKLFTSAVVLNSAVEKLQDAPPEVVLAFDAAPSKEWAKTIEQNLRASSKRGTNLIELSYRAKSPEAATAVVAAILSSYLDFMDKNHKDVSLEIVTILDQERKQVEETLAEKQDQMLDLQHRVGDLGMREGSTVVHPAVQRVVELNRTLIEAQKNRVHLEALQTAVGDAVREGRDLRQHLLTFSPEIGRELLVSSMGLGPEFATNLRQIERQLIDERGQLNNMLAHYGEAHPKVIALRNSIVSGEQYMADIRFKAETQQNSIAGQQLAPLLTSLIAQRLAETRANEKQLLVEYQSSEAEAVSLNDRVAALQLVDNEVQRLRRLHETLLNQISKIDINQNQSDVRVAVVGEPLANENPVSPNLKMTVLLSLLIGLGGGAALVYGIDLLDDRFRSPEEMVEQLGAKLLAAIRPLSLTETHGAQAVQVHVNPTAVESEAFRTLRTVLSFGDLEGNRLIVTSTEPSDGKTTVISNLGASFAQSGKRTLLIDCDLRKPGLSTLFQVRGLPGLSDLLRSSEPVGAMCEQRILSTGIPDLDLLPCGPKAFDAAELLSGSRIEELIAWAEIHYDQLLIDTPPILAASDAALAARHTDGILMVVQPVKNNRRLVMRAVDEIRALDLNLIGVIANRIDVAQAGYYGYGYGYGYGENDSDDDHISPTSTTATSTPQHSPVVRRPDRSTSSQPTSTPTTPTRRRPAATQSDDHQPQVTRRRAA